AVSKQIEPLPSYSRCWPLPTVVVYCVRVLWRLASRLMPSLLALAGAFIVVAVIIALSGSNPLVAFGALIEGAFGSADAWSEVGVKTTPLLLAGLAVAVAFQAGVWNIGAEGQLLMGALGLAALGTHVVALPGWLGLSIGLLLAGAMGALWAGIAALLKLRRN